MTFPSASIIVPVKEWNNNLDECLSYCSKLDYTDFQVILLPDNEIKTPYKNVTVIATGSIGPSEKRDIGINKSSGDIIAFLDDDAYPEKNWLKNAVRHFEDPEVGGVGGPAVTPQSDNIWQQASGAVYESYLASAQYVYRYLPGKQRLEDDYPTVNFIVTREIMKKIGGFGNVFWPGEDTVLCLKITHELKKKIIYDPKVLVYHHRRQLFKEHNKQVSNYATHRGYFVKKFPQTSLRPGYFVPSIFVLFVIFGGILSFFITFIAWLSMGVLALYLFLLLIEALRKKGILLKLLTFLGIIDTHVVYGLNFIKGLLAKELKR